MNNFEFYLEKAIEKRETIEENITLSGQAQQEKRDVIAKMWSSKEKSKIIWEKIKQYFSEAQKGKPEEKEKALHSYLGNVLKNKNSGGAGTIDSPISKKLEEFLQGTSDLYNQIKTMTIIVKEVPN